MKVDMEKLNTELSGIGKKWEKFFKAGDWVEVRGVTGTVRQYFHRRRVLVTTIADSSVYSKTNRYYRVGTHTSKWVGLLMARLRPRRHYINPWLYLAPGRPPAKQLENNELAIINRTISYN